MQGLAKDFRSSRELLETFVDPQHLDRALQRWNEVYAGEDESLAIDGKTMCNAIDDQGYQTHIMSVIGHQTKICHTQKSWYPASRKQRRSQTHERNQDGHPAAGCD
jgi:hypothetical protein